MIQSISKPASKSKLDVSKVANKENEEKEPENRDSVKDSSLDTKQR